MRFGRGLEELFIGRKNDKPAPVERACAMRAEARDLVQALTGPGGARFQRLVYDLVIAEGRA
jgi:hypothetical protein